MGFNRRKMEDQRREAAEKEAASRRATDAQALKKIVLAIHDVPPHLVLEPITGIVVPAKIPFPLKSPCLQ
jgi:hypothetical protein